MAFENFGVQGPIWESKKGDVDAYEPVPLGAKSLSDQRLLAPSRRTRGGSDFSSTRTLKSHAASSGTDDTLTNDTSLVLALAAVHPDARTKSWCDLLPKMEGCFSKADLRLLPIPRNRRERNPNTFLAAAVCVPTRQPLDELQYSAVLVGSSTTPTQSRELCLRTSRRQSLSQHQHQQQPACALDPFFRQPLSSTPKSALSDSHHRQSSGSSTQSGLLPENPSSPPSADHRKIIRGRHAGQPWTWSFEIGPRH